MTQEENTLINYLLIGTKLNALKLTLSDKQLETYNNHIIDEVEKIKPTLVTILKSDEQVAEILKAFLV
jgi:hypothetical protein